MQKYYISFFYLAFIRDPFIAKSKFLVKLKFLICISELVFACIIHKKTCDSEAFLRSKKSTVSDDHMATKWLRTLTKCRLCIQANLKTLYLINELYPLIRTSLKNNETKLKFATLVELLFKMLTTSNSAKLLIYVYKNL